MTGIFFYSILIFILLSIFVPSIYNYAYSCFIGRIVLVLLILYFSKHSILLGLVFVAIIIVTSMPLYEGFYGNDILAKNLLVTSNTSIKDTTNNEEVFEYITKFYCAKDSSGNLVTPLVPNQDKLKRWNDIMSKTDLGSDSYNMAISNTLLQQVMCNPSVGQYYQNYNSNWNSAATAASNSGSTINPGSITGCSTQFIDENVYCSYWANNNQCSENPGYMLYRCSKSCNQVSGNPTTGTSHVLNTPVCLSENLKSQVCNDDSIRRVIPTARNISNNPNLDPYLQQDGQWMQNMYSQLCPETSPVF